MVSGHGDGIRRPKGDRVGGRGPGWINSLIRWRPAAIAGKCQELEGRAVPGAGTLDELLSRLRNSLPVLKNVSQRRTRPRLFEDYVRCVTRAASQKMSRTLAALRGRPSESRDDLLKDSIDDILDISLVQMRMPSNEAQYQL
jgi:hypothetical protein